MLHMSHLMGSGRKLISLTLTLVLVGLGLPSFAPEHFQTATAADIGRYKQFRRGIDQLDQEGVVQVLRSDLRGDQSPVLAAVGPMQFEVVQERMTHEFNSPIRLSRLDYQVARRTDDDGAAALVGKRGVEVLRRSDGTPMALFVDKWRADVTAYPNARPARVHGVHDP